VANPTLAFGSCVRNGIGYKVYSTLCKKSEKIKNAGVISRSCMVVWESPLFQIAFPRIPEIKTKDALPAFVRRKKESGIIVVITTSGVIFISIVYLPRKI